MADDDDRATISARVPLMLRDAIDAAAQIRGQTRAAFVEQAVRQALNGRDPSPKEPRRVESRLRAR